MENTPYFVYVRAGISHGCRPLWFERLFLGQPVQRFPGGFNAIVRGQLIPGDGFFRVLLYAQTVFIEISQPIACFRNAGHHAASADSGQIIPGGQLIILLHTCAFLVEPADTGAGSDITVIRGDQVLYIRSRADGRGR